MNYFTAILMALLIVFAFVFAFLFKKYENEKALNVELQAKLEAISKSDETKKIESVIKYQQKKVEVIKKVPYKDDICENKLNSYNTLINSF